MPPRKTKNVDQEKLREDLIHVVACIEKCSREGGYRTPKFNKLWTQFKAMVAEWLPPVNMPVEEFEAQQTKIEELEAEVRHFVSYCTLGPGSIRVPESLQKSKELTWEDVL